MYQEGKLVTQVMNLIQQEESVKEIAYLLYHEGTNNNVDQTHILMENPNLPTPIPSQVNKTNLFAHASANVTHAAHVTSAKP
jgi:hypothetical protein